MARGELVVCARRGSALLCLGRRAASTCNEALCCALRSALCLGQPLARGVDVQLMRRSALQRLASESLRGVQRCRRLACCVLSYRLSYRLMGAGTSAASRRVAVLRGRGAGLAEQLDKRGYSRPLTARREFYKQLRLSQDC